MSQRIGLGRDWLDPESWWPRGVPTGDDELFLVGRDPEEGTESEELTPC